MTNDCTNPLVELEDDEEDDVVIEELEVGDGLLDEEELDVEAIDVVTVDEDEDMMLEVDGGAVVVVEWEVLDTA